MKSVKLLLVEIAFFVFLCLLSRPLFGQCSLNIPSYVTIVNGTQTIDNTNAPSHYYVGFGDTLYGYHTWADSIFVDAGGTYIDTSLIMSTGYVFASNYSYVRFDSGFVSIYYDSLATLYFPNTYSSVHPCSPMAFYMNNQTSQQGNFSVYTHTTCTGPEFKIITNVFSTGMNVVIDFGDGNTVTAPVLTGNNITGYVVQDHIYAQAGNYLVTQKLYVGTTLVDSGQFLYNHRLCENIPFQFFLDYNSNCVYDQGEQFNGPPLSVIVDSMNIAIDTISALAGFTYTAYGSVGTQYEFKAISNNGVVTATCPLNGVVSDTLQPGTSATRYIGLECTNTDFDLTVYVWSGATPTAMQSMIFPANTYCTPKNAVVTMSYDLSYTSCGTNYPPMSQGPQTISWTVNGLTAVSTPLLIVANLYGSQWPTGTPVSTTYSITPVIGDQVPGNNTVIVIDTVVGSFDPNAIYAKPSGCVPPGTELEYTITFENLGNGPAENIYVLDTLPTGLDPSTMKLEFASHSMFVEKIYNGSEVVFKFDFPDIMLPDSTSPDRHGMLVYKIKTLNNYPIGSSIDHSASIYFDYNPPVLTNTTSTVMCWPASVSNAESEKSNILIYPNPATDELTIKTDEQYNSYTISNNLGQQMLQADLQVKETKLSIKSLPSGIYYLSLEGESGTAVRKFVKM